jgi:hypothetical protein
MTTNLQAAFDAAVAEFGQDLADKAAEQSVEAFNTTALAGASAEQCEAEQLAAFAAALTA